MTNQYKQDYDQRKALVLDYLERSSQQLRSLGNEKSADSLDKLKVNVEEGLFSIVLVGEFSRGKSTFLNALMHKRILPSFSGEATATVNFLRYIDQAPNGTAGRVFYNDGSTKDLFDLDRSTIEKVVSTKGNSTDTTIAATVDHVDLYLDSAFLKNGVMLVDSPGLNSMMEGHQEITERQILESHACIFMFSSDQPGNKSEFESLGQLRENSNNIFFVLNKISKINENEGDTVESVIEELKSRYEKQFPDAHEIPKIWPIDSYDALVARDPDENPEAYQYRDEYERRSRFSDFEDRLWRYLTQGERARVQLTHPVEAAMNSISSERRQLFIQLELLKNQQSSEHLVQQKEFLEKEIAAHKAEPPIDVGNLSCQIRNIVDELIDSLPRHKNDTMDMARLQFQSCATPEDLQTVLQRFNPTLKHKLETVAQSLDNKLRSNLLDILEYEFSQYLGALEEQIQIRFEGFSFKFDPEPIQAFDGSINIDLKGMLERQKELENQIAELENQQENVELRKIQVRRIERDIADKKSDLKTLKASYQYIQTNFQAPSVVHHMEERDTSTSRGGVIGVITDFLFGKKKGTKLEKVSDRSAHDEAIEYHNANLANMKNEIEEAQRAVDSTKPPIESSDELEFQYNQLQRKKEQFQNKLQQLLHDDIDSIKRQAAQALEQQRNELMISLNDMLSAFIEKCETHLNDQKRIYCRVVRETLANRFDQVLHSYQEQLDEVIQSLNMEAEDRKRKFDEMRTAYEATSILVEDGANLAALLETNMSDEIEVETFSKHSVAQEVFA